MREGGREEGREGATKKNEGEDYSSKKAENNHINLHTKIDNDSLQWS